MASNHTDNVMDESDESGSLSETEKTVQSLARLSLDDNGQRNWQEESEMHLDVNYPDWKALQSTRMVPPVFPSKAGQPTLGDEAENKMFNLIEEFGQKYCEPMFVVHSYDFAALIENAEKGYCRREWVKGECDFVIIHRHFGLFVIETKSKDTTRIAYESGLKQISKVKKVVASYCKKTFQEGKKKAIHEEEIFKYYGFVAMPNCNRQKSFDCGLFKEDCQDVESFKKWWDQKVVRTGGGISQEVYEALLVRLVPITCVAPTLNTQIERTHERITTIFTPNQLEIMLQSCPKQWITGPAGCGKTVLLIQKVKEVISNIMANKHRNQERVLVLCYNKPLSVYLSNEINDWFKDNYKVWLSTKICTIKTYHSFLLQLGGFRKLFPDIRDLMERKYRCESPRHEDMFHHIFVDEGQDFPGCWPELLERFHKEEDPCQEYDIQYYFWVMIDSCQHVQFTEIIDQVWIRLKQAFRMKSVLRNTKKIFLESKKYFNGLFNEEIKLGHTEVGQKVWFDDRLAEDNSNGVDVISNHIDWLLREKVERKDVIILTRHITARDILINELKLQNLAYKIETAEGRLESRNNVIALESIRRFKGLESKVVIVYNPEYSDLTTIGLISKARELLYIAMSRCFCYLVIVSTKEGCCSIQSGNLLAFPHESDSSLIKKEVRPLTELMNTIEDRQAPLDQASSRMNVEHSSQSMEGIQATHRQTENYMRLNEFGKTSWSTRCESGPPERKRFKDRDDEEHDDPEAIESAVMVSKMEERQIPSCSCSRE